MCAGSPYLLAEGVAFQTCEPPPIYVCPGSNLVLFPMFNVLENLELTKSKNLEFVMPVNLEFTKSETLEIVMPENHTGQ
jgi:hypothetical protein